jgi:sugar phosphate isomerase/epimerase
MQMPTLAVSSWSIRHSLGPMYPGLALTRGTEPPAETFGPGTFALLDFPDAARAAGIGLLDICHFHFPCTDDAYLQTLTGRLTAADVQVLTLLIDEGDISAADPAIRERDLAQIREWVDVAARIGARAVRVVAGESSADACAGAIRRSAEGLAALAKYAGARSVDVLTENWKALTMAPDNVLTILDAAGGTVGLCADFGNYRGPEKYDALQTILPRATTIHAHATAAWVEPGAADQGDLRRCLDLARAAAFTGAYVLIFDGGSAANEWPGIARMAAIVRDYC